jgi:hypothetical protein
VRREKKTGNIRTHNTFVSKAWLPLMAAMGRYGELKFTALLLPLHTFVV